ncbi:MAG TPA: Gfo/Idh/MocA family oxidoreductase [Candidatus Paceibacterota bacterium]|nr:Gfo/Idh/MocA family oxidoreductase [Verrucomicrobiota bacterium]HRZ44660.1 Gfo/Idh/MocA family oxidoreductase [Candidatus Paceibacterota bacterium]HRZ93884.1 Gfo/Idh/MocA family oxidoreductase [Candidatus Paceibacterota bacterium]
MNTITRRSFLKSSLALAASASLPTRTWARVIGANDDVRVAVVGFNSQGRGHIASFRGLKGVRLAALCDVDRDVLAREAAQLGKGGSAVATYTDVRKLLENPEIDAISTASPNHWHSLISVWACQAGKDVYVEKPVSHNVWEGRQVVQAARKYKRIVQTGTQCRSNPGVYEGVQFVRSGGLGKARLARGLCYKRRASIGKTEGAQPVPVSVDYNLWTGPAPMGPLRRKNLHYDWHWVWPTGCGDLGNQGIHQMDLGRWALGVDRLSSRVFSVGGRFGYVDDGETPNTQIVFHDFGDVQLVFEVRGLPGSRGIEKMDSYLGASIGVVVHCEKGYLVIPGYANSAAYDLDGKLIRTFEGEGNHFENFIQAVRSRKWEGLNADIEQGHLSSALCHTGNISYRLGKQVAPEEVRDLVQADSDAMEACERAYEHLQANEVDLEAFLPTMGLFLRMDPKTERFVGNAEANRLLRREYRDPFVVPEQV